MEGSWLSNSKEEGDGVIDQNGVREDEIRGLKNSDS